MDLAALLALLGVSNAAEASAAISGFNQLLTELLKLSGQKNGQEALALLAKLNKASGAETLAEALARVEGMNTALARLPELEAEVAQQKKREDDARANEMMRVAQEQGRLPAASKDKATEFYNEHGLKALEQFLAALPASGVRPPPRQPTNQRRTPGQGQPSGGGAGGAGGADDDDAEMSDEDREAEARVARLMGKSPQQAKEARQLWNRTANQRGEAVFENSELFELNNRIARERTQQGAR